jgi:hypothetical protein
VHELTCWTFGKQAKQYVDESGNYVMGKLKIFYTTFLLFLHCFEIFTIDVNIPSIHQTIKGRMS